MRSLRLQDGVTERLHGVDSQRDAETGEICAVAVSVDAVFACSRTASGLQVTRGDDVLAAVDAEGASVVCFAALDNSLSLICSTGELIVVDVEQRTADTVGDIEGGIRAAAWSPDEVRGRSSDRADRRRSCSSSSPARISCS